MKNIDFLPEHYHHERTLRRARLWWVGVAALFGLMIALAASGQWGLRRALDGRLASIEPRYAAAMQRQTEIAALTENRKRAEDLASLYLYLEHPWPTTQVLAAVVEPLTPALQLTSLQATKTMSATPVSPGAEQDTNHAAAPQEHQEKATPQTVLAQLRSEHDRQQTIVELNGLAENSKELHDYVDALARSPLFVSASLKGLESEGEVAAKKVSKFSIRIIVIPGYGQPGGAAKKASRADVTVLSTPSTVAANFKGVTP